MTLGTQEYGLAPWLSRETRRLHLVDELAGRLLRELVEVGDLEPLLSDPLEIGEGELVPRPQRDQEADLLGGGGLAAVPAGGGTGPSF